MDVNKIRMDVVTQTEDYDKPKIFVATPCYVGQIHVKYLESMLGLQQIFIKYGIGFEYFNIPFDSLIPRARNASVTRFMQSKDSTHLLFIDADIQFHAESVVKMLKENKDVIAGCYPKKAIDFEAVKNNYSKTTSQLELIQSSVKYAFNFKPQKQHKMERGVLEVLDAPTGFMMVKKSVIRRMIKAFPETEYKNDVKAYQVNENDRFFDLFQSQVFDKRYLSEDYGFCRLWQKLNGTIHADLTVKLNHIGQFSYYGDPMVYLQYSDNIQMSDKPNNQTAAAPAEIEKKESQFPFMFDNNDSTESKEIKKTTQYKKPEKPDKSSVLNELLDGIENGVYMDIGTNNGDTYSKKLESWKGFCIEANSKVFEKLKENRESDNCKCLKEIVYETTDTDVSFTMFSDDIDEFSGITNKFNANDIFNVTKILNENNFKSEKVTLKTKSLDVICKENEVSDIDYLAVDTCGSELEVLKGLGDRKVKVLDIRKSAVTKKVKQWIKDNDFKFHKSQDGYEYYTLK